MRIKLDGTFIDLGEILLISKVKFNDCSIVKEKYFYFDIYFKNLDIPFEVKLDQDFNVSENDEKEMVITLRENLGILWQSLCYSTGNLDFELIKREKEPKDPKEPFSYF